MFLGVNLVREKFFLPSWGDSGCLHNNFICQPLPACLFRLFVAVSPCWNCALRVYNSPCVAFSWRLPWVSPSCVLFSPLWTFLFLPSVVFICQGVVSAFHLSEFRRFPSVMICHGLPVCRPFLPCFGGFRPSVGFCTPCGFPSVLAPFSGLYAIIPSYNRRRAAVNLSHNAYFALFRAFAAVVVFYTLLTLQAVLGAFLGVLRVFREAG